MKNNNETEPRSDSPGIELDGNDSPAQSGIELGEEQPGQADDAQHELEAQVKELQNNLQQEKEASEELYQRMLRLQADFDNYRRRVMREQDLARQRASENLILSLLPVLDNMELALAATCSDADERSLIQGVEMTYRQLLQVLQQEGLELVDAVGAYFDPVLHEAVGQIETNDVPDNTVYDQLRRGFKLKERTIRPALVRVARSAQTAN